MSDPDPGTTGAGNGKSHGARYLFLLLLGLVIGIVATVMLLRAWNARQDPFPDSVMHVQQWHLGQLTASVKQNRCSPTDTLPHLQTLRAMANDIEPAFPDLRDHTRGQKTFADHASQLRATLDDALASPPLNCAGVATTAQDIGAACKACHQDFRG